MSFWSLLRVELRRQLHNPISWLLMTLTLLAPMTGYTLYCPAMGDSMATLYLANPMLSGGIFGCFLFAVWMALSLNGPRKSGVTCFTDSMCSPIVMNAVRLTAVLLLALIITLAAGLFYLPYTALKLTIVFSFRDYWLALGLIFLPALVMGAVFSCIAYQFTERLDVSLTAVLAFLIFSRTIGGEKFLWQWSVPLVPALSDAFGSSLVWRTAIYSHVTWMFIAGGLWGLSLLFVRQYGKGAAGIFIWQCRHYVWKPFLSLALIMAGAWLWNAQPFMDHSPENWTEIKKTDLSNEALTLLETNLKVHINSYLLGTLSGTAVYQLQNHSGQPQELYMELNPGYELCSVTANGMPLLWEDLKNDSIASRELRCTLPADPEITLEIDYGGCPKMWNVRESLMDGAVISAQNINLTSFHLAPVMRNCVMIKEDTKIHMQMSLPKDMTMVTSGFTELEKENEDGTNQWSATATGTDGFQLFAGDYVKMDLEGGGMPIHFYYSRKYQKRLESMEAITMMEQVISYCTNHYGSRSYTEEEPFKIVQLSAFSFGGYAKNNFSGMGETYFTDQNLNDSEKGAASAEVLAHEIIHQWWGLGAALMDPEDDIWSDEGITTYTTYRLMCELKGKEYGKQNYVEKWREDVRNNEKNFYLRHPEYLDRLPESYANDIRASNRAVNWYSGNALMIYELSEIVGEKAMDEIWSELYQKCKTQEISFITKNDFLKACGFGKEEMERE